MGTTVILPLVVAQIGASSNELCPKYCQCNESKFTMVCDGKHGALRYMPKPPKYVRYFHLTNTNLGQMTKASMANLTSCNVTNFYFVNNTINNISPDALSELEYLELIHWEQMYFPISEFCLALQQVQLGLFSLSVVAEHLDAETVWASSFQHLTRLQILHLNLNEMKTFNTIGLKYMVNLSNLNLGNNLLYDFVVVENVPNLQKLSLQQNDLDSIPVLCSNTRTPLVPNLEYLNLQDNTIRDLETSNLSCLEHLQYLNLGQNRIKRLHDNAFAKFPGLKELRLSSMTYLQFIDELVFNSSTLAELYFTHNPQMSVRKFTPRTLFKYAPNLKTLDMSYTKLSLQPQDLGDLLIALKNIEKLKLVKTSIITLPSGVFSQLTELTHLVLSNNRIYRLDTKVFANVTSIKYIYLDGNKIQVINESSFPVEFRHSVKEIDLAHNPFSCTCDLLWFRNWMTRVLADKSIHFHQYPSEYRCRSPIYGIYLDAFNPTLESCTVDQPYFVYLVISLSVCIVFTVAVLVTYRYRWYILYWISLMRQRRQQQPDPPAEMQYDGFVSYSNPDWDWVSTELIDFLEGEVGLHLCEHNRDFRPGMYIIDNIIKAIDTSRKTILVISNEYVKSDWCQFELQMILSSFLKKEIDIVVILLEQIQSCHVTSSLRALMVSTTYLQWSDDPEARRLFKPKLRSAMGDVE